MFEMKCKYSAFECAHSGTGELGSISWAICVKKCDYAKLKLGDMKTVSTVLLATCMFAKNRELKQAVKEV